MVGVSCFEGWQVITRHRTSRTIMGGQFWEILSELPNNSIQAGKIPSNGRECEFRSRLLGATGREFILSERTAIS